MADTSVLSTKPRPDCGQGARPIAVQRLSRAIGVLVDADALVGAGPDGTSLLRQLVADHHVVFIKGFGRDPEPFQQLATSFGALTVHPLQAFTEREQAVTEIHDAPTRPPAGFPWHTDLSWLEQPPRFGFLQALEIPDCGGDTMWASMKTAFHALSPPLQELCSTLTGLHGIDASLRRTIVDHHGADLADRFQDEHPPVEHPLVRAHPDTGEACLYLSPMYLQRIVELQPDESAVLLAHLHDLATDPNRTVRWRWSEGDVAIWDESCTLHRALVDHHPSERRMRRCTVQGGRPVPAARRS